jgi:hypothetical protein
MQFNTSSSMFEAGPLSLWLSTAPMFEAAPAAGWATWQQLMMTARNPWCVHESYQGNKRCMETLYIATDAQLQHLRGHSCPCMPHIAEEVLQFVIWCNVLCSEWITCTSWVEDYHSKQLLRQG